MHNTRMQILVSAEQRSRLRAEARERGVSVAALVREAIDEKLGPRDADQRVAAWRDLRGRVSVEHVDVEEIERILEDRAG